MSNGKNNNCPKRLLRPLSFLRDGHHQNSSGIYNIGYDYNQEILINKNINIVLQPIVDLSSHNFHAFEALSRPSVDAPLANKSPFAILSEKHHQKLDLICLEHIFKSIEQFSHFDELNHQKTYFFVNCMLANSNYLKKMQISQSLKEKTTIEFDLNHTFFDINQFLKNIHDLKKDHFKIALDDIGETQIDLQILNLIKPDFVKIDIAVVLGISKCDEKLTKAKLIIERANQLGSKIIAEGVENKEDLDIITSLGVNLIQGFLFSKPMQFVPEKRKEIDNIIKKAA